MAVSLGWGGRGAGVGVGGGIGDVFACQMLNRYDKEKGKIGQMLEEWEKVRVWGMRRMESAMEHMHLTSSRTCMHMQQSRVFLCFFFCDNEKIKHVFKLQL